MVCRGVNCYTASDLARRKQFLICRCALPSEFCREALPRALKAGLGPRFFSVKLQLLATLLGLASVPSSGPGDWAFPLAMGALEGLGNTLSFKLAFRLRGEGRQPQREFNPFNGPSLPGGSVLQNVSVLFLQLCFALTRIIICESRRRCCSGGLTSTAAQLRAMSYSGRSHVHIPTQWSIQWVRQAAGSYKQSMQVTASRDLKSEATTTNTNTQKKQRQKKKV